MPSAPIIHFVGHASFVVENQHAALLADPWLAGTAFNDGWCHSAAPRLDDDLRARISDVYISHEHPDHFSPPSLSRLAGPGAPTVRIQTTRDGRVAAYCRAKGFEVTELPPHERFALGRGFEVVCGPHRHMDSWLLADIDGTTVLNLNDCRVTDAAQALRVRSITGPVDVLFTQFSYANWVGNPDEVDRRRAYADLMLGYVRTQIEILEPRYVVPFASFIRFGHAENAYLTDDLPGLREVVDYVDRHTSATAVAMYPGDVWVVGEAHDTEKAIERYEADASEPRALVDPARSLSLDELQGLAADHVERLRARSNQMAAVRVLEAARFLPAVRVRLWDLGCTVEFRCDRGLEATAEPAHVAMGTDSLAFCLEHDFGAETLYVNGRYRVLHGPEKLFFRHFYPAILNNQGFSFPIGAAEFLLRDRLAWRVRAGREALRARRARKRGLSIT